MLVSIEGIDGSGKTTAWEALRERRGEGVTFTREPTGSWYGDAVRRSVADPDADPLAELFLYTADHAAHLASTVRPALADGRAVVTDRYVDSRYAYQSVTLDGVVPDPLEFVMGVHEPWTRPPDRTILLDVDPETAAERSGATDKFEQVAFLRRVADRYDALARRDPDRFVRVDANRPPEAVVAEVTAAVEDALAEREERTGDSGPDEPGDTPRNTDR